eukprot:SAG11_NODE_2943_length_2820_cov_3.553105_3_plen_150_part_00
MHTATRVQVDANMARMHQPPACGPAVGAQGRGSADGIGALALLMRLDPKGGYLARSATPLGWPTTMQAVMAFRDLARAARDPSEARAWVWGWNWLRHVSPRTVMPAICNGRRRYNLPGALLVVAVTSIFLTLRHLAAAVGQCRSLRISG